MSDELKAEFFWVPENKCRTSFYAIGPSDGTWNIHEALKFKTEAECAKWCDNNRISGAWVPTQHGFCSRISPDSHAVSPATGNAQHGGAKPISAQLAESGDCSTMFTVRVFAEQEPPKYIDYKVRASTESDARQLAFALDGGWGNEKDASGMLALAETYTQVLSRNQLSREGK